MNRTRNFTPRLSRLRRGFTLVEMLVATGLVVLMMLMFAQVFQTAAGLVSNQKGMAELDQNVRTLTTLLRGDIKQRTFVDVVPFVRGQDPTGAPPYDDLTGKGYAADFRRGFFSISENDKDDPTDDVLHLTIRSDSPLRDEPQLPYSGRSRLLRNAATPADPDQYLFGNPDQPEFDDGQTQVNSTGSSRYAEVCWFLRNGTLYRRVLLIRDPYNDGGNATPEEPKDSAGNELINTFYDTAANNMPDGTPDNFWRDFDYSAYWDPGASYDPTDPSTLDPADPTRGLKFHTTTQSLQNSFNDPGIAQFGGLPQSLGVPFLRYGSSISRFNGTTMLGPREYIVDSNDMQKKFIGRYTVQECSDSSFIYPGTFNFANDPFNEAGPTLSLNANGLVTPYADDKERRGEDIVMTNVHEFDIQVWDDGLTTPGWVNLGHSDTTGHYHLPVTTPPITPEQNRYDTWHPSQFMPGDPLYAPFIGTRTAPTNGLGEPGEIWLRAIRIKIRFYDVGSEQMRDLTFTFRLNRENSRD